MDRPLKNHLLISVKFYIQLSFLNNVGPTLDGSQQYCMWLWNDHLIAFLCLLHLYQVFVFHSLSLWLPLVFKVSCRLFWSCSTAVILSPLINYTRKGTSSWLYCYLVYFWWFGFLLVMERCLQAILWMLCVFFRFIVAHRLHFKHPLSAFSTNGKLHLSIFMSHAQKLLNHIIAEWKQGWLFSKALYCNRKITWLSLTCVIGWPVMSCIV